MSTVVDMPDVPFGFSAGDDPDRDKRRDDNPEVFKTRLHVYREQTAPVTEYYRSQGLLNIVDGLQPIDSVTEQLAAALAALSSRQIRSDVR